MLLFGGRRPACSGAPAMPEGSAASDLEEDTAGKRRLDHTGDLMVRASERGRERRR